MLWSTTSSSVPPPPPLPMRTDQRCGQGLADAGAAVGGAGGMEVYPGGDVGVAECAGEVVADVVGGCGDGGEVGGGLDGDGEL